jgi:all-trans-retinol 13,14-reductase
MTKYDVAIIGAGLGGLVSAVILSKEGKKVVLVEKGKHLGGSIQGFRRQGVFFDTGGHYVGGMEPGQNLYRYLNYLGVADKLNIERMDEDGFDRIIFENQQKEYSYAQGFDNFVDKMSESFPENTNEIRNYINQLNDVGNTYPLYSVEYLPGANHSFKIEHYTLSIEQFFDKITSNKKLQQVLGATNLVYAGGKETTPYYIHALVINSYIQSSYRFLGGALQLANRLGEELEKNGGTILRNSKVEQISFKDKEVEKLILEKGEAVYAKQFISDVHPSATLQMIPHNKLRKVYRHRIDNLENTYSVFSIYIVLKPESFLNINHNLYYFKQEDVWNVNYQSHEWPKSYMLLTQTEKAAQKYADGLSIIAPMMYEDVKKWEGSKHDERPQDYLDFKAEQKERLLDLVEQQYPGLRSKIDYIEVSTPLTYQHYTATCEGSLYGIKRDFQDPLKTNIAPKTKIPNFYFTGQNIDLHGVLGTTISAVLTCSEILGLDYLLKKIVDYDN